MDDVFSCLLAKFSIEENVWHNIGQNELLFRCLWHHGLSEHWLSVRLKRIGANFLLLSNHVVILNRWQSWPTTFTTLTTTSELCWWFNQNQKTFTTREGKKERDTLSINTKKNISQNFRWMDLKMKILFRFFHFQLFPPWDALKRNYWIYHHWRSRIKPSHERWICQVNNMFSHFIKLI